MYHKQRPDDPYDSDGCKDGVEKYEQSNEQT